jgi:uncharacterized protein YdeI (YjbR/CyaY-like superfamily)
LSFYGPPMNPRYFRTPAAFRAWLVAHHATKSELWVGFHKKATGHPSITWPESVDEALCFGWIDGIRKSVDEDRYMIRFSPRKSVSVWSAVNIRRVAVLTAEGRMAPAGLAAFAARRENKSGIYSYEQRSADLVEPYAGLMRANAAACKFFQAQPPWYRKAACWWVVSAKKEETRRARLDKLMAKSAAGRTLPQYTRKKPTT